MESCGVVDALETFASFVIAVSYSIEVDVVVTVAESARLTLVRVAEITVRASFAPCAC